LSILHDLRDGAALLDEPLVGAAIGLGSTAEAAERGGADFLLVLAAGRYRAMGAASIATMLPLADANRFTDGFGRREILGRVSVPVFFGACAFDPIVDLDRLVSDIAEAGYHGVANFPTAIHYDGRFRAALEEARLGFGREVEMLVAARRAGLASIGYAKTRAEVERMVAAEVDLICLNFGWNAGGMRGVNLETTLDEAVHRARQMVQRVKQVRPDTLCLVEGGPIVHPDDMFRVCRTARADGYIGGSTLDRVPLELSVMQATSAFKAYGLLRDASAARSKGLERAARLSRITGRSEVVQRCLARLARLGEVGIPVLLVVEAGFGRTTIARSLHALAGREGPTIIFDPEQASVDHQVFLFGPQTLPGRGRRPGALDARGGTVIVRNAAQLTMEAQHALVDWLEQHGGDAAAARLVLVAGPGDLDDRPSALHGALRDALSAGRIDVPPLRDRPEDIPDNVRDIVQSLRRVRPDVPLEVSPDGFRTLIGHDWPENLRELRRVIEEAAVAALGGRIGSEEIRAAIRSQTLARPEDERAPARPEDERGWILDGLRRNRFRRGETARFLGLSRKTLYNKMRRYGID
jgi:predicted TIM-barrel enzyme/transcriptional regulator with AAA-type ATPase domain